MTDSGGQTHGDVGTKLTFELLYDLYVRQCLTQRQIGERFGISQPKVSKLLRRWSIPRLIKSDRLRLPPLTPIQHEVLLGSLMGDGSMSRTGKHTARFYEGHSPKQDAYTRWKADLLEPYTAHVFESDGLSFYTHGCRALRPYFDLFYGEGKRVFPVELPDQITPLALAVWYMDDGSVLRRFHPRISFGLDAVSLERADQALRQLGLIPKINPEGSNWSLTFPGQNDAFYELVSPHTPPCMAYKVPDLTARRKVYQNQHAAKLTSEEARRLRAAGHTYQEIADMYGVGLTTARRRALIVDA